MLVTWSARPAAVLASLFLVAAPAAAQGTAEERSACMGDAFRLCSADIPDVPKIETCMEHNKSKLSPACRAEFKPSEVKKTKLRREHFR